MPATITPLKGTGSLAITAQNTFTNWTLLDHGDFNLSIQYGGGAAGTVTVQRSFDQSVIKDVEAFTANTEKIGTTGAKEYYRLGVKTGEYTSGTITVQIYQH